MRVLHLDSERTWRGGQQQVAWLVAGLARRGVAQDVAAPAGAELLVRLRRDGLVRGAEYTGAGAWDPRGVWAVREAAQAMDATVVHAHSGNAHTLAYRAFAGRLPIVVTRRVDFAIKTNWLSRAKYRSPAVHFIAISSAVRDALRAGGVPQERIALVPSGIDPARARSGPRGTAVRAELLGGAEGPLVGFVGALVEHKDPLTLARAAAPLARRLPGARVVFIGEGRLRAAIESVASGAGIIHLAGHRADVPDCLAALDVFCMPSREEGLCTSLLDAQAAGVPCVITRAGGMIDIVTHESNGLVVPVGDAEALADALATLATDGARRERFAAAGRAIVDARFTTDAMVEGTLAVYRRVTGAPAR